MTPSQDPARTFLPRLAGFVAFLRLRGLRVGTGAALDCADALRGITLLNRDAFLEVCKVTLAKSPAEIVRLVEAFDVYWNLDLSAADSETPLAMSVPSGPPPDDVRFASESRPGIQRVLDREGVIRVGMYSPDAPSSRHALAPEDRRHVLAIRAGVRRFRRHAATLPGRRMMPARLGSIDFRATARHSLRQGGECVQFRFHRRKRLRAELVILWDVSGSMRDHDDRLFALVYTLQRVVRRTRVFAFGTRLEEVTDRLQGRAYGAAAEAMSRSLGSTGGGTRIGSCLEDFLRRDGHLVHSWTTVLVMSDGWDLGDTIRLGRALERLHRLCHLVVWVNPYADEKQFEPATAGMQEALPHVDMLLGPGDFETSGSLAPDRVAARRSAVRSGRWGKAFIAAGR